MSNSVEPCMSHRRTKYLTRKEKGTTCLLRMFIRPQNFNDYLNIYHLLYKVAWAYKTDTEVALSCALLLFLKCMILRAILSLQKKWAKKKSNKFNEKLNRKHRVPTLPLLCTALPVLKSHNRVQ